jgi:hypothetical protein
VKTDIRHFVEKHNYYYPLRLCLIKPHLKKAKQSPLCRGIVARGIPERSIFERQADQSAETTAVYPF